MDHSLAQQIERTCPQCGRTFEAEVWLIVDLTARPDLAERIKEGTLHTVSCPHCGHGVEVDAPVLVFRPHPTPAAGRGERPFAPTPPLLFSPARRTTPEQDRQQAAALVAALRERLGDQWRDEWLTQGLPTVPRDLLPLALTEGWEAAQREMERQARQALERLREEEPEAYRQLEEAATQAMQAAERAQRLLEQLGEAEDKERFLREHLDEFDDGVLAALGLLAQAAAASGERETAEGIAAVAAGVLALRLEQNPMARRMMEVLAEAGELGQTLFAFIQADTWAESRSIVEQHPELLSDEADALLDQLIEAARVQGDESAQRTFEEHRALLRRCREVGVERAFAALTPPPAADAATPSPLPPGGRGEGVGGR
ncbi:MAG TPA: hypothetical protein ENK56_06070, partial [Chloroflexi bacterium]|nr:hypothetical protein [Chloroflexota bacterium]